MLPWPAPTTERSTTTPSPEPCLAHASSLCPPRSGGTCDVRQRERKASGSGVGTAAGGWRVGTEREIRLSQQITAGRAIAHDQSCEARQRCLTDPVFVPLQCAVRREAREDKRDVHVAVDENHGITGHGVGEACIGAR